jgi:hypothetical protein
VTDRDATVSELVDLWQQGELTLDKGTVKRTDHTTLCVEYEGTDGTLKLTYTLAEELSYRSDGTQKRFNILTDQ